MERCLVSPEDSEPEPLSLVAKALLERFPGSEQHGAGEINAFVEGEHVADLYLMSNPDGGFAINLVGDEDDVVCDFLIERFGLEELDI